MFDLLDPDGDPDTAVRPDASGTPAQRLAWVHAQEPSAVTLAVLESLVDVPLGARERIAFAVACQRQAAGVIALGMAAEVAATTAGPGATLPAHVLEAELALALRRSDRSMGHELHKARRVTMLPVTFTLLRGGEASVRHAQVMAELTGQLRDADAVAVDAEVGARAATMTVSGFRRVVRKTVAKLDSRPADEKKAVARRSVGVKAWPAPDGLVAIAATMPAAGGVALLTELNRRADGLRVPDEPRSHGERQVDALLGAVLGASASASAAATTATTAGCGRSTRQTEIQMVIDWRSLLGLRDTPGELLGYGPIPAEQVRAMLALPGTVLRRLVNDPLTGVLVDYGTTRYRPDSHLAGLTKARDVTCRYPGCTRNAIYCDGEHCRAYPEGSTSAGNVCQLCRAHHRRKTFDGFAYARPDPATGETLWTTPLGFSYRQAPACYDDAGPDPGDTVPFDNEEANQRWVPRLPTGGDSDRRSPPPPSRPPPQDPPF